MTLRLADRSLARLITMHVRGGKGGEGGSGGDGGSRGSKGTCKQGFASDGNYGHSGPKGTRGPDGEDGTSETDLVPASELQLVSQALATNPALRLEGSDGAAPRKKRSSR